MRNITLCGDVHGRHFEYKQLTKRFDETIQLGDFGFNYNVLRGVDGSRHKIVAGNHDNYDIIGSYPHYLGDFGVYQGLFFLRGAFSVDKAWRIEGHSWWRAEELEYTVMLDAHDMFVTVQPSIVISHDCPSSILRDMFGYRDVLGSATGTALSYMFEEHQPELWVFGHHHKSVDKEIGGTRFVCLDILETMTI